MRRNKFRPGELVLIERNRHLGSRGCSLYHEGFIGQVGIVVGENVIQIKGSGLQHWEVMVEGRVILVPGMNMGRVE